MSVSIPPEGSRHPACEEVGLVVEVAEASLSREQGTKKRLYAQAAIPVYWIVNLLAGHIEVYGQPSGPVESPDYSARRDYRPGDEVPLVLDGRHVALLPAASLLP